MEGEGGNAFSVNTHTRLRRRRRCTNGKLSASRKQQIEPPQTLQASGSEVRMGS